MGYFAQQGHFVIDGHVQFGHFQEYMIYDRRKRVIWQKSRKNCTDILTQVSAAQAALNSFNKVLLASHIRTCVAQDIRDGKEEVVDELVNTLLKLMK